MPKERTRKNLARNVNRLYFERERCRNPWNGRCENTEIALYILYEGEQLPICRHCWDGIANKDFEWGEKNGLQL